MFSRLANVYGYLASGTGCIVASVNSYNNYKILEFERLRSHRPPTEGLDHLCVVLVVPVVKGFAYGLTFPFSISKIVYDRSRNTSSQHFAADYPVFRNSLFTLSQQNKVIGVNCWDRNFEGVPSYEYFRGSWGLEL